MTENLPIQAMIEGPTALADWLTILPVVIAMLGSALLLLLHRSAFAPLVTLAIIGGVIACDIGLLMRVLAEGPVSMTMGNWPPPFGISFTADVFGAAFALAAALVTGAVVIYAELDRAPGERDYFHALVLLLLTGVSGSFLTGDLFNLYVWFEVMLIASFGLLVLGGSPAQLDGAVKYGFLNFLATTFFLLALGLVHGLLGTLNMADILLSAPQANPAAMAGIAGLLLLAFGMKAAAFPLNAWLPASYHTPSTAVSALFAGVLTKVGAYALLRTLVALLPGTRDLLEPVLVALAIGTLVLAPLGAIAETNLRRAIGFLVVGGIGSILAGLAMASSTAIAGAGLYILSAIVTMTAIYMVAGLIENRTGQRDTREMGGLYAAAPMLSVLFIVAVLASAGMPPFMGFWPKLLLLDASLNAGGAGLALTAALLANAVLTLIAGTRLWAHIFWRSGPLASGNKPEPGPYQATMRHRGAVAATAVLVAAIVAAGVWPEPLINGMQAGSGDLTDPMRYAAAFGLLGESP